MISAKGGPPVNKERSTRTALHMRWALLSASPCNHPPSPPLFTFTVGVATGNALASLVSIFLKDGRHAFVRRLPVATTRTSEEGRQAAHGSASTPSSCREDAVSSLHVYIGLRSCGEGSG